MRHVAFSALIAIVILAAPLTSMAAAGLDKRTEQISDVNRVSPLQNPKYDRSEQVLGRRILDRKHKVVGSVQDVILTKSGNIAFLDVKFDRMQLAKPVFVNYTGFNIETVSNGYAMTFDASEIENAYPQMLADIDTAAGETADNYSLRKLQGTEIRDTVGKKIGNISDILFANDGQRAEAVYVSMTQGTLRGKAVAIPFNQVDFSETATTHQAVIDEQAADTLANIAKGK
jgi:sporulation protein YlmC with PRC-barrel domain